MTWEEFFERLAKSGIDYFGIGEDAEGFLVINTNLRIYRDEQGVERLIEVDG